MTKFTPETSCTKVPVELCGPAACGLVPGPTECYEKQVNESSRVKCKIYFLKFDRKTSISLSVNVNIKSSITNIFSDVGLCVEWMLMLLDILHS